MEYCHTPLSLVPSHSPTSQAMSDMTQYGQLGLLSTGPGTLGRDRTLGLLPTMPGTLGRDRALGIKIKR